MGVYAPFCQGEASFGRQGGHTLIGSWNLNGILSFSSGTRSTLVPERTSATLAIRSECIGNHEFVSCSAQTPSCRLHSHWDSLIPSGRMVQGVQPGSECMMQVLAGVKAS